MNKDFHNLWSKLKLALHKEHISGSVLLRLKYEQGHEKTLL